MGVGTGAGRERGPRNTTASFGIPDAEKLERITYFLEGPPEALGDGVALGGWSMTSHLRAELVLDALDIALWQRWPDVVIHHPEQSSQYTSIAFGTRCREAGVRPSMGSVGDAYDNAVREVFFATLECELINRRRFCLHAEARMAQPDYPNLEMGVRSLFTPPEQSFLEHPFGHPPTH